MIVKRENTNENWNKLFFFSKIKIKIFNFFAHFERLLAFEVGFSGFLAKTIFGARSDILFQEKKFSKKISRNLSFSRKFRVNQKKISVRITKKKKLNHQ